MSWKNNVLCDVLCTHAAIQPRGSQFKHIRSFSHSFFPSLESELTSQPQSTTIEKACKYWAEYGKRKRDGVKMDASTEKSGWARRARKKRAKYSEVEYWAYTLTQQQRWWKDGWKNDERNHENDVRSNNPANDKHCISSSNTQTRTHSLYINTLQISAEQLWKSYLYWIWLVFALGEPTADLK